MSSTAISSRGLSDLKTRRRSTVRPVSPVRIHLIGCPDALWRCSDLAQGPDAARALAGYRWHSGDPSPRTAGLSGHHATTGRVGLMYELPFGLTPMLLAQSFPGSSVAPFGDDLRPQRGGKMVELGFRRQCVAGHRRQRRGLRRPSRKNPLPPIPTTPDLDQPARCAFRRRTRSARSC